MGRLIKAGVMPLSSAPVSFRIFEREAEPEPPQIEPTPEEIAAAILSEARAEAQSIVNAAKAEAERIKKEARQQAYDLGHQDGLKEGLAQVRPLVAQLESDIGAFQTETQSLFDSLEPEILKLCLETVEKVIRHEVKTNPKVVSRVIMHCLRRVKESHEVRVRVNPAELENVRSARDELLKLAEGVTTINIVDDRRVSAGGCIIETANGDFDATIETQLEKVEQALTESFENDRNKTQA